jgi:steroid delta-isomerase-like uncharacterized protein
MVEPGLTLNSTSGQRILQQYLEAYNSKNVCAMLSLFADDCVFENFSGGRRTECTHGKGELEVLAKRAAAAFASREQKVLSITESANRLVAEIEYHALLQLDLTPELTAGTKLHLRGISVFEFSGGKITRLSDYS